jgi:hypothetical protein
MHLMQVTVVCALVVDADLSVASTWDQVKQSATPMHWWRDVVEPGESGPFDGLLRLFDKAEVIVAFNGLGFDMPVLRKYYGRGTAAAERWRQHRIKCLDPMYTVSNSCDIKWPKLDKLLQLNGLPCKTGDGLMAIKLWREGKRGELKLYCERDVTALAELVHLDRLNVGVGGSLPNRVHGLASAILAHRAMQPVNVSDMVDA